MTNNNNKDKEIALSFFYKAFALYPEWNSPNLPEPRKPTSLEKVDLSKKQMANVPLDDISKSVLCGTILGDTSFRINKNYKNARFQVRHSTRQLTWFVWKYYVILKEFTTVDTLYYSKPDGYQSKSFVYVFALQKQKSSEANPVDGELNLGKLKVTSKAHPKLTQLHNVICAGNRFRVERSWLNHMNNYFLMTLWLDDGSLTNGRQGVLSINSVPIPEQQIFREYLLAVWDIKASLQYTGELLKNGQPNVRITIDDCDSLLKLFRIIAPVIPVREMLYKVCFVPKNNPSLLQRWKSELKGLVRPEFAEFIEDYYNKPCATHSNPKGNYPLA